MGDHGFQLWTYELWVPKKEELLCGPVQPICTGEGAELQQLQQPWCTPLEPVLDTVEETEQEKTPVECTDSKMPPNCTPVLEADEQMTLEKLEDLAKTHNVTVPLEGRRKKKTWLQAIYDHNERLGHPPPKKQPVRRKRPPMEPIAHPPPDKKPRRAWWYPLPEGLPCTEVQQQHLECDEE